MKKFLSLVLALVMTMSLVTISAGAKDFTDADAINYVEAVDVMSELKIVDGDTTGAFNPEGKLTRGAAAKIICNMILGPTTAAALHTTSAPFPDVPADHVFAGYIAYCVEQGIISGYTDGTFKPANPLTGYAFLKMLLGALGYDQYVEGYAVPNWSVNVAKQAIAIGLDDGNDNFDGTKIVNREEALLYAFNTMKATMVDYNQKTEVQTGNSTVTISGGRFEVPNDSDKIDYNGADDNKQQFVEKYFPKVKLDETAIDEFGRWVNTWTNKGKEIGSYVVIPNAFYTADVKEATIYDDLDLDDFYTFDVFVDGEDASVGTFRVDKKNNAEKNDIDSVADVNTAELVGNGSDIYVYFDEDRDDNRIVVINTFLVQVADDYDEKDETLDVEAIIDDSSIAGVNYSNGWTEETLDADDWTGLDQYADEDYVLVTIADGEIMTMKKAEPVKAAVTEYVHAESVTAGGELYKYSAAAGHLDDTGAAYKYELKSDYNLFLDEDGYVLYATGEKVADKLVYVTEFSKHSTSSRAALEAYAYFLDGTEAELKIAKIKNEKVNASNLVSDNKVEVKDKDGNTVATYDLKTKGGMWFKYTEKDGKYNLTIAETQTEEKKGQANNTDGVDNWVVNYKKFHTEVAWNGGDIDANAKTSFIVLDEDNDVKVYTGIKSIPNIESGANTIVNVYSGTSTYAKCVFIDVNDGKMSGGNLSTDVIFLLKREAQGNDADDDEYYRYKALKNGVETTVMIDKTVANSDTGAGYPVIEIEYSGKNYIVDGDIIKGDVDLDREDFSADTLTGKTVEQDGEVLQLAGTNASDYFMAKGYKIFVIDGTKWDTYTMKQLERAADKEIAEAGKGIDLNGASVYGVLNADNEYTTLFIKLA